MEDEDLYTTLAHSKNPKSSRRTTFQDELEAAVNERAVRNRTSHSNSNDFNDDDDDDDDDVLKELLKTRRKKINMPTVSRTKTSISDYKMLDDEEENIRPKKGFFLKSQRNFETLGLDALRPDRSLISHQSVNSESLTQQTSQSESPAVKQSQSVSSPCRRSLSESPMPLNSENSQWESSSEGVLEATPPRPAPRQRAPPSPVSGCDEKNGPACNKHTSGNSGSDAGQDEVSVMPHTHSRPLEGAESTDLAGEELRDQEKRQLDSELCETSTRLRPRSPASRPGSSRMSRRTPLCSTESRYLGTLKVLEQKCLQETGPDTVDSLRAAIYQDWLKKKEEKLQVTFRVKKEEEKLKEEKKAEEEASKKAEAKASYEAWKEKKREALRETIREKQEALRKLQKETEDKEERKETAKRVFEKWKREHDEVLREQHQKQLQTKNSLKEKKEKEKEERKRESRCSFTQWSDRKKEVIEEKLKSERRKQRVKEVEERYEKEEREKTALELYDKWLRRKENEERRERKMKAGVVEEPPSPAWSPPNRTIPFGK